MVAANPAAKAVKIVEVTDKRVFEARPSSPSTPSLENAADIKNAKITERAIARKRGGYGNALGDIVLPEGRSVAGLVRSATEKALRDKGYRVVAEGSPEYASAIPVSVEVNKFWAWFKPGFAAITIECEAMVTVTSDAFMPPTPHPVLSDAKDSGFAALESMWIKVISQNLGDLSDKMGADIKPPS